MNNLGVYDIRGTLGYFRGPLFSYLSLHSLSDAQKNSKETAVSSFFPGALLLHAPEWRKFDSPELAWTMG